MDRSYRFALNAAMNLRVYSSIADLARRLMHDGRLEFSPQEAFDVFAEFTRTTCRGLDQSPWWNVTGDKLTWDYPDYNRQNGCSHAGHHERRQADPQPTRLLTTPVRLYKSPDDGMLDGGLFVFVHGGTNPEVVLILEAMSGEGGSQWRAIVARLDPKNFPRIKVFLAPSN